MYSITKNDVAGTLAITIATRFNNPAKGEKKTPCKNLFNSLIKRLEEGGFTISKVDTRPGHERPFSKEYRYGKCKDLEVEVERSEESVRFKFYQNINTGDRPKGDGRYCFQQVSLMPQHVRRAYEDACQIIVSRTAAVLHQESFISSSN